MTPPPRVAIVGSGASGTLAAIHLLRRARQPLGIVLLDRQSEPGRGVAYGTTDEHHLLNVRSSSMSALPDTPADFAAWVPAEPTAFVPRLVYARYLKATLRAAAVAAPAGVTLETRSAEVVGLVPDSRTLTLRDGPLSADRVVLALGNFPPRPLGQARGGHRIEEDPWSPTALDNLDPGAAVLLVGTGLTMVDVVVSLVQTRGHRGPIDAISRRGLLPQVHAETANGAHAPLDGALATTTRGLLRQVRRAARASDDWRGVIDALRPVTQSTWQAMPYGERGRFLRHVQPYWDTHRHRVAPRIGQLIADTRATGQLSVWAGRLVGMEGRTAHVALRRGGQLTLEVERVINCTGPATSFADLADPLIQQLVAHGLATLDPLRLGFTTADDGRLVDARGQPSHRLFSLGPMRRGELWESTSVPDIRVQAARLAEVLVAELGVG